MLVPLIGTPLLNLCKPRSTPGILGVDYGISCNNVSNERAMLAFCRASSQEVLPGVDHSIWRAHHPALTNARGPVITYELSPTGTLENFIHWGMNTIIDTSPPWSA